MTAVEIQTVLTSLEDPAKAEHAQKFFKTGPGEYGEGDLFRGIRVPVLRQTARRFRKLPLREAMELLQSPFHEDRFVALCVLVYLYNAGRRKEVYRAYLDHTRYVNNWDLVDTSAHKIVGPYLLNRVRRPLYALAVSRSLWERRIAILSTYFFIKRNQFADTLALSEILLGDSHDLIHKATGWMLREVGKRDELLLLNFLDLHYRSMPRTMLRYAIERLDKPRRQSYVKGTHVPAPHREGHWQAYRAVMEADRRLRDYDLTTPVLKSSGLGQKTGGEVFLKQEHLQQTGSFKFRGALSKMTALESSDVPITAASTGNHGLAMARALAETGHSGTIFLPETADGHKIDALHATGVPLIFAGQDGVEAELAARAAASSQLGVFVSPYNDWQVLGGQGIIGLEILSQLRRVTHVFASVGGGGLIAGVAAAMKAHNPLVHVVGCSPEASAVMHESVHAGSVVHMPVRPTLSDGTAGGIEPDSLTLPLCKELVDTWITVTEDEIAAAMQRLYELHEFVVEGAAGVALASLLRMRSELTGAKCAVILCGGNIEPEKFRTIIGRDPS